MYSNSAHNIMKNKTTQKALRQVFRVVSHSCNQMYRSIISFKKIKIAGGYSLDTYSLAILKFLGFSNKKADMLVSLFVAMDHFHFLL